MKTYTVQLRATNETKIIKGYGLTHALAMCGMKLQDIKNWTDGQ